jgi:hypothetical protein
MFLRYLTLLTLLGFITGCSTSSVFTPYPARALSYQQALSTGTPQPALDANKKQLASRDALLALLEQGRIQQLAGDYTASKQSFTLALAKLRCHRPTCDYFGKSYRQSRHSLSHKR